MKKLAAVFAALILAAPAFAQQTREVLVLNSAATELPRRAGSKGFLVVNQGPNPIHCALGSSAAAVVDKAILIPVDGSWSAQVASDLGVAGRIWCIASTADQLTGNATTITETF